MGARVRDAAGEIVRGCRSLWESAYREATTELDLHLRVYRRREDHGAVTWGRDLAQARIRMESMEHGARILLAARALGKVNHLTREQIDVLERIRGTSSYGQINHGY